MKRTKNCHFKTMTDDEMMQFIRGIDRAELADEIEERPNQQPRYLKAVRVTLIELGYDEEWVGTTFRDALEMEYL